MVTIRSTQASVLAVVNGFRYHPCMTRLRQLLLAESLRHHPQGESVADEPDRLREIASHRTTTESRLLALASGHPSADRLRELVDRLLQGLRLFAIGIAVLGGLLGFGAAGSALGTGGTRQVEALLMLLLLLGPPLFALVLLVVLQFRRRYSDGQPGTGGLAGLLLTPVLAGLLRLHGGTTEDRQAVARGASAVAAQQSVGLRLLMLYSHLLWGAYALSALIACFLILTLSQYDFVWGSTLFDAEPILTLLLALGWLPGLLGFPVPDPLVLEQTRQGISDVGAAARSTWGWFLFGAIFVYGLLPRLFLAGTTRFGLGRAVKGLELDAALPHYQRMLLELRRAAGELDRRGDAPSDRPLAAGSEAPRRFGAGSNFALIALELDQPGSWPPAFCGPHCLAMGHLRTRQEVRQAEQGLRGLSPRPAFLVILVSLLRSPDRGSADRLRGLIQAAGLPTLLLIGEQEAFRQRDGDIPQRTADWWQLASRAGALAHLVADDAALSRLDRDQLQAILRGAGAHDGGASA